MEIELPEGIFLNFSESEEAEAKPQDVVESWTCDRCGGIIEALIVGENGRYQGQVRRGDSVLWQSSLPRDPKKARDTLLDYLNRKIQRHLEVHK